VVVVVVVVEVVVVVVVDVVEVVVVVVVVVVVGVVTEVVAESELLPGLGSIGPVAGSSRFSTVAELTTDAGASSSTRTVMENEAESPANSRPAEHSREPAVPVHPLADTRLTPAGSVSVATTAAAANGPWLVTTTV
jgi:hypothetical protein